MKIVGTIVNENMSLIGCIVSQDKKKKPIGLGDVKKLIKQGFIDNFEFNSNGEIWSENKKLSNLKMFTSNGKEIENKISIKAIIVDDNEKILGARLYIHAFNKEIKVKLEDLVKLYNYCEPTNFMLRNRDNGYIYTGKGETRKEDIPVIKQTTDASYEDKILDIEDLKILGILDAKGNCVTGGKTDIRIPKYIKNPTTKKIYRIVGIGDYVLTNLKCATLYLPETIKEISKSAFFKIGDKQKVDKECFDFTYTRGYVESGEFEYEFGYKDNDFYYKDYEFLEYKFYTLACTSINIPEGNPYFCTENGVLYNKNKTFLYYYPTGTRTKEYVMPESVKDLGDGAFYLSNIEKLVISPNLSEIKPYSFFKFEVSSITFPSNSICEKIGKSAFERCYNLKKIKFPKSLKKIDCRAFYNSFSYSNTLVSIDFPEGLEEIGDNAFTGCFGISGDNIFSYASDGCKAINFKSEEEYDAYLELEDKDEYDNSYTKLDEFISSWLKKWIYCGLYSISIPSTCKCIGKRAFYKCKVLTSVTLSEGVERIEEESFDTCYAEIDFAIPSIKVLNEEEFDYVDYNRHDLNDYIYRTEEIGLSSPIIIPSTCKYIGKHAFNECELIPSITILGETEEICFAAFEGCLSVTSIKILGNIKKVGNAIFWRCPVEELELPDSIKGFNLEKMTLFAENQDFYTLKIKTLTTSNNDIACFIASKTKDYLSQINFKGSSREFLLSDLYKTVLPVLSRIKVNYLNEETDLDLDIDSDLDWTEKGSDEINMDSFNF